MMGEGVKAGNQNAGPPLGYLKRGWPMLSSISNERPPLVDRVEKRSYAGARFAAFFSTLGNDRRLFSRER
jgi:hypothetical protein